MNLRTVLSILVISSSLSAGSAFAYDCSALSEWKRQHYYLEGAEVQYEGIAYVNRAPTSKRDFPDPDSDYPWQPLGECDSSGGGDTGGDGGGNGGGDPVNPQVISIYGIWHCGNSFCDWSQVRDTNPGQEFDMANRWIIDRNGDETGEEPSVNLVVLSFLKPMELLQGTTNSAFLNGIPRGMTPDVVSYFTSRGIRVLLSMGGVTYTDSWNQALATVNSAENLATKAVEAVDYLAADGLEIDWENGRPTDVEMIGIEAFIDQYNLLTDTADPSDNEKVLTLDLAVGNRYLQELSRRASADWLPNGEIEYINAMVPRGEPGTDQWQEHVDGKANYDPPILPKAPAKIAVSMWLTDGRTPNDNCVDFSNSTQSARSDYVRTVLPNGEGTTNGFAGMMFWAGECPSSRNVCTTPPNGCEGGMGMGATEFSIGPLNFSALRQQ